MSDEMTIEQAADYLRGKLPTEDYKWFLEATMCSTTTRKNGVYEALVILGTKKQYFYSCTGFAEPVRAAVDWAKGQEAGNG